MVRKIRRPIRVECEDEGVEGGSALRPSVMREQEGSGERGNWGSPRFRHCPRSTPPFFPILFIQPEDAPMVTLPQKPIAASITESESRPRERRNGSANGRDDS